MNKKFRVGIWLEDNYLPEIGGGFGYFDQIIDLLMNSSDERFEFKFISDEKSNKLISNHKIYYIKLPKSRKLFPLFQRVFNKLGRSFFKRNILYTESEKIASVKNDLSNLVDIIYYPTPSCPIDFFPFIATVWDLGHLNTYSFPEVSEYGEFERRTVLFKEIISKALIIICESQSGKNEFLNYYPLFSDRIEILPLLPSKIISNEIRPIKPEKLSDEVFDFIHYPAQFWPHKNHYNLILAFNEVRKELSNIKLILTGSDKGNKNYIFRLITELGLENSVIYLGFVSINELKWLYLNSRCMVMPTFLGPTNMPLLEAASLNCNVACSNLSGHIEQLGKNAEYFNPHDISDITRAILVAINNEKRNFQFDISTFEQTLYSIFMKAKGIRLCWD